MLINSNTGAINPVMVDRHHLEVGLMSLRDLVTHLKKATAREWSMWNDVLERSHPGIAPDPGVVVMRNVLTDIADTITTITTMRTILVLVLVQIRYIL